MGAFNLRNFCPLARRCQAFPQFFRSIDTDSDWLHGRFRGPGAISESLRSWFKDSHVEVIYEIRKTDARTHARHAASPGRCPDDYRPKDRGASAIRVYGR